VLFSKHFESRDDFRYQYKVSYREQTSDPLYTVPNLLFVSCEPYRCFHYCRTSTSKSFWWWLAVMVRVCATSFVPIADRCRLQVGGCAVSFGLVSIWCMHFVGNRAIILGDGEEEIQLYYSSGYTAISAILPVVVIFLGLLIADRFYKGSKHACTRYSALFVCGICAGAAVTEMHYLGNNGTTNYRLQLSWPHVFGAAGIAVGACLISFGLFFHWSGHWVNFIWRRIVVACFLALAVSGMHWTAAAGTWYEIRGYHEGPGQERNINLIIALCLVKFIVPRCRHPVNMKRSVSSPVLYASYLVS
jgi:NO-binding membrane sensor protein with MHYT domain